MPCFVVQQATEYRRRIEPWKTKPVHRAHAADERRRMTIGNQSIVGDWEAAHSSAPVVCSVVLAGCISVLQTGLPQPPSASGSLSRKGLHIWSACADKSLAVFQCRQETDLQSCLAVGRFWEAPMSWSRAAAYKRPVLLPLWRSSQKECRAREPVLRSRSPNR